MLVSSCGNSTAITRKTVREAGASQQHGCPIKAPPPPETSPLSPQYGGGFRGAFNWAPYMSRRIIYRKVAVSLHLYHFT